MHVTVVHSCELIQIKDGASKYKGTFTKVTAMGKRQILARVIGIKKKNMGSQAFSEIIKQP